MIEGIGSWRNFDDIEEYLILDELLLLNEQLAKRQKDLFKMQAALQGVEINDDGPDDVFGDELPKELIEKEREWQKKKQENSTMDDFLSFKLGYEKV